MLEEQNIAGEVCNALSGTNHSSLGVSPATQDGKAVSTMTAPLMPVFTQHSQLFPQEFSQYCLFNPPQIPSRQAGRQEAWVLCSPGSLAQDSALASTVSSLHQEEIGVSGRVSIWLTVTASS